MAGTYFIRRNNGKISGPHTLESVKAAAKAKKLTADDMIGSSQAGPWKRINLGPQSANKSGPPPISKADDDGDDWLDEPIEEADDDDLPPLPVSPIKSKRKKLEEEAEEKAERKKKPKKIKESGTAGSVLRIAVLLVLVAAVAGGLGVTILKWNPTDPSAKKEQKQAPAKKIPQIERIVVEIQSSIGVGIKTDELKVKLQNLATEIELARRNGSKVEKYDSILEILKDATEFWEKTSDPKTGYYYTYRTIYLTKNGEFLYEELHEGEAKYFVATCTKHKLKTGYVALDDSSEKDASFAAKGATAKIQVFHVYKDCFSQMIQKAVALLDE